MPTLHLLGTGASLSGPGRTTTMLALESGGSVVLVDCGGDAVEALLSSGLDPDRVDLLILTHEHPDHVGAFPLLVQKLWLGKRSRPLPIRGPARALDQARRLFETFDTSGWRGLPPLGWGEVEATEGAPVWTDDMWHITAAPGQHGRTPTIGLRVEARGTAGAVAYSSDTERSGAIARLARGAQLLVHEATGEFRGHSRPEDAAHVAAEAGAARLVLVHLPPQAEQLDLTQARAIFPELRLGRDGDALDF
jgi:ribonuclease Z